MIVEGGGEEKTRYRYRCRGDETESTSERDLSVLFNEDELEVARTLLDMKHCIIKDFWPLTWFSEEKLRWGAIRMRSALAATATATAAPVPISHVQKATSPQNECGGMKNTKRQVKAAATSPATPLAFSPSESDDINDDYDKSNNCHRKSSKKRSRDELLKTVKELTDNKIALSKELKRLKSHYDSILAYNRELKAIKKQVKSSSSSISSHKTEEPKLEKNPSFHVPMRNNCHQIALAPVGVPPRSRSCSRSRSRSRSLQEEGQPATVGRGEQFQYQYPYVHRQMTAAAAPPIASSNSGGLDRVNHVVGPAGNSNNMAPTDLMICADGGFRYGRVEPLLRPLDIRGRDITDQKAKYAAARWERRLKIKCKNLQKH